MLRHFSGKVVMAASITAMSLLLTPAFAQTVECDTTYVVERGDNLSSIAQRAYGNQGLAQYLYDVNWRIIGNDPSQLQPGDQLAIPCIGSSGQQAADTGEAETAESVGVVDTPGQVIAFLTAENFAPFTDKVFPEGGMLAKVVRTITSQPIEKRESKIYWVNDWSAHLDTLLIERNAFDAAFPWYRPDCSRPEILGENDAFRCERFRFSDPLYKVVVPFYTRSDNRLDPRTAEDMRGQRVCRPTGYFTFDLAEKGLIAPRGGPDSGLVTLVRPDRPIDCFRLLMNGEVDFVTINAHTAASPIRALGIADEIVERDGLSSVESLHVIVPRELPQGTVLLHEINQRLRALRESGDYEQIARKYLEIYYDGQS